MLDKHINIVYDICINYKSIFIHIQNYAKQRDNLRIKSMEFLAKIA